jgi:hypothetical protein
VFGPYQIGETRVSYPTTPTAPGDDATPERTGLAGPEQEAIRTIGFLATPETTAEAQRILDENIAELGYVMNISRLWAYQPTTQTGLANLLRQANSVEGLSLRQRTILVSAYASVFGDRYCALVWGTMLAKESDAQTAAAVAAGRRSWPNFKRASHGRLGS